MSDVNWGNYAEAYKALHDAIRSVLTSPPEGKSVTKIEINYNADGTINNVVFKQDAETLFTLTWLYETNKTTITRT